MIDPQAVRAAVRRREAVAAPDEPRGERSTTQQRRGDEPEPEGDVRQHPAPLGDERRGDGARALAAPHGLSPRPRLRPCNSVHRQKPGKETSLDRFCRIKRSQLYFLTIMSQGFNFRLELRMKSS